MSSFDDVKIFIVREPSTNFRWIDIRLVLQLMSFEVLLDIASPFSYTCLYLFKSNSASLLNDEFLWLASFPVFKSNAA